jgi:hypothetical protein
VGFPARRHVTPPEEKLVNRSIVATSLVASLALAACSSDIPTTTQSTLTPAGSTAALTEDEVADALQAVANEVNAALVAQGADYRIEYAEWFGADAAGQIVFFNDRGNKRLPHDFVPGDPRRGGRTNITYIIDQPDGNTNDGLTTVQTSAAIQRAMNTWNSVKCSTPIPLDRHPDVPNDLGVIEFFALWGGGSPFSLADITHAGWIAPGRLPPNVIAVTFTFIYVSADGTPSDINNDKRADVAFREIYYNDQFVWQINADIDVETVALHEAGHGLSQAHFGKLFGTFSNLKLHFAPRAVMNAGYTGVQQKLTGTDNAGHCTSWGSWPNR